MNSTERIQELKDTYHFGKDYNLFYAAFQWSSFSPDRRAEQTIIDYSNLLEEDLKELGDNTGNYKAKFEKYLLAFISAQTRCASSMITGPSNFNVRRNEKANNAARSRYEEFSHWRKKYFEAVNRIPTKSPEQELDEAEHKLNEAVNFQEEIKEVNKLLRKNKFKNTTAAKEFLKTEEYSEKVIEALKTYDYTFTSQNDEFVYILPHHLTNNNALIKRLKEKVQIMLTRIERKNTWKDIQFEGGYITIEDDRLKIYHESKPSQEIINEIKSNGYRWSPHWKCWCRKHTGNAVYCLKHLTFLNK